MRRTTETVGGEEAVVVAEDAYTNSEGERWLNVGSGEESRLCRWSESCVELMKALESGTRRIDRDLRRRVRVRLSEVFCLGCTHKLSGGVRVSEGIGLGSSLVMCARDAVRVEVVSRGSWPKTTISHWYREDRFSPTLVDKS